MCRRAAIVAILAAFVLSGPACGLTTTGIAPDDGGRDGDPDRPDPGDDRTDRDGDGPPGTDDGAGDESGPPRCGNGTAEAGEACDGDDLRGATCESLGRLAGTLGCTSSCMYTLADCPPPLSCGNGTAEVGEACDGADLRGADCTGLGFAGGSLACADDCILDTTACIRICGEPCTTVGAYRCAATAIAVCRDATPECREWAVERDCAAEAMVCDAPAAGPVQCLGGSGDSCASPQVVGALPVRANGGDMTADYADDQAFLGARCQAAGGVEAVFVRFLRAGETVRIRETGAIDVVLRVLAACADDAPCLADRNAPEDPGLSFTAPAAGNYYFVVEAVHAAPASKGYDVTIEEAPDGELCTDPIRAGTLPAGARGGDIVAAYTDDYRFVGAGCSPADGVEAVLARTMRAGDTVRLRETGSVDVVLRVLATCGPTAPCLADRDAPEDPGLTFTAPADGTYFFVVESKYAFPAPAGYEFVLEDAPEGNVCGDPVPADPLPVNVRGGDIGAVFTDDATFAGPGCSPADGVELFFARDMLAGETARIRDTGSVDLVLRVVGSCAPDAACLADRNEPENPGLTFTAPADGRYWFVAESYYSAPASTAYDVTVDDPPPGELCSDPRLVTAGDAIAGGDFTLDWANDLDFAGLGCTPASGAELVLAIYMAEAASVRIRELGSLDVVIRVLTACAPAASCLYNLDLPEDPGVLFYAVAAGWYYIVVESVNAFPAARAYDIRIDPA